MSRYLDTPNRTPVQAATVTLADLATLPIWAPRGKVKDPKHRRAPLNPKSAAGAWGSVSNPATWSTPEKADRKAATFAHADLRGVGLRLSAAHMADGMTLAGLDLDGCRDAATGAVAPWAQKVLTG